MNKRAPWTAALLIAACFPAYADDAAIAFGGNPNILHSHPSIRMVSEKIVISVGPDDTVYLCHFVLRNDGPGCSVQIGFPDRGFGAEETAFGESTSEAAEKHQKPPLFEALHRFASKVDGKPVATRLLPDHDLPASWHAKVVKFGAGQTHVLEESFSVGESGGITMSGGYVRELRYVLDTGSSWRGKIGTVEILVDLRKSQMRLPAQLQPLSQFKVIGGREYNGWDKLSKQTVLWSGFAKPEVTVEGLRFFGRMLKPSVADNITLSFGYRAPHP